MSSRSRMSKFRPRAKGKAPARSRAPVIQGPSDAARPISAGILMYRGPVSIPRSRFQEDVYPVNMFFEAPFTSSGIGIIANVYTNDPTNCIEWPTISATWEEFRVLAFELEYFPSNRYSKTATFCVPGVGIIDHSNISPLGSLAAGFAHGSNRVLSLEDPWTGRRDFAGNKAPPLKWEMSSAEEAVFTSTSATLSNGSIKFYFGSLSNATTYGIVLIRFLIQFRGRV